MPLAIGSALTHLEAFREDASAAYSVGAYGSVSRMGDKAFVQIFDQCPMDYNKAELALSLLEGGMKDCDKYIDADKVEKIKANMLKNLDEELKTNGYWLNVMDEYNETGVDLYTIERAWPAHPSCRHREPHAGQYRCLPQEGRGLQQPYPGGDAPGALNHPDRTTH